jgi:hypothetical protein
MSTTGYYAMAFTEINPTSTLTTIDLWYDKEWTGSGHWVIGPFKLIQNDAPPQTPDTITPPAYAFTSCDCDGDSYRYSGGIFGFDN